MPNIDIKKNISLAKISYYKIGGTSDYYVEVKNPEQLKEVFAFCKQKRIPYYIVGNTSNVLFDDKGFRGLIIKLISSNKIKIENPLKVFAGELLHNIVIKTTAKGYGGLEKLAGIPASVGGAVIMNAGAFGKTIGEAVKKVEALSPQGKIILYQKNKLGFGYRKSRFSDSRDVVLSVEFELHKDDPKKLKSTVKEILERRKEKQPLDYPSCGSVFKNPERNYAAKLIEEAGLKGFSVGNAMVSSKHANFIVNTGKATSKDVKELVKYIQNEVKAKFNIDLEQEVIFV